MLLTRFASPFPKSISSPSRSSYHHPCSKTDFPKYDGGDPQSWILEAENYFRYYHTYDDFKVDIACRHLEGRARDFFTSINMERTIFYWEELVEVLLEHYGPIEFQNPDEYLCSIQQMGSVQEYHLEFAKRSARVKNWPEHCLLGVFLGGLKEELRVDVRIHKPHTMNQAASLALEYEKKLMSSRGPKPNSFPAQSRLTPSGFLSNDLKDMTTVSSSATRTTPATSSFPSRPTMSTAAKPALMDAKRQQHREKGLCSPYESLEAVEETKDEGTKDAEISFNAVLQKSTTSIHATVATSSVEARRQELGEVKNAIAEDTKAVKPTKEAKSSTLWDITKTASTSLCHPQPSSLIMMKPNSGNSVRQQECDIELWFPCGEVNDAGKPIFDKTEAQLLKT